MHAMLWGLIEQVCAPAAAEAALTVLDAEPVPVTLTPTAAVPLDTIVRWAAARNWKRTARAVRTLYDAAELDQVARTVRNSSVRVAVTRNPRTTTRTAVWLAANSGTTVHAVAARRTDLCRWLGTTGGHDLCLYLHDDTPDGVQRFLDGGRGRAHALAARTWLPMGGDAETQLLRSEHLAPSDLLDLLEMLAVNEQVSVDTAVAALGRLSGWRGHNRRRRHPPAVLAAVVRSGDEGLWRRIIRDPNLDEESLRHMAATHDPGLFDALLDHPALPFDAQHQLLRRIPAGAAVARRRLLGNPNIDPDLLASELRDVGIATAGVSGGNDPHRQRRELLTAVLTASQAGTPVMGTHHMFAAIEDLAAACLRGDEPVERFERLRALLPGFDDFDYPATTVLLGAADTLKVTNWNLLFLGVAADARLGGNLEQWQLLCGLLPGWDGSIGDLLSCVALL